MPSYIVYIIPAPPLRPHSGTMSYTQTPGITRKVVDADSGPAAAAASEAPPGSSLEVVLLTTVEQYDEGHTWCAKPSFGPAVAATCRTLAAAT